MLKMKEVELSKAERETAKAKKKLDTAKNAMKKLNSLSSEIRQGTTSGTHSAVSFKASQTYVTMLSDHSVQAHEQMKQLDFIHKEHVKIQNQTRLQRDNTEKFHHKIIRKETLQKEKLQELRKPPRPIKRDEIEH